MLSNVSALAYLKQAEEIFAKGNIATEGLSHPEAFIRARALALWQEQRNEAATQISEMIEGAPALDELDVIGQTRLTSATRRLLEHLLRPKWFQTPAVLGHAKLFFADFQPASADDLRLGNVLKFSDAKLREYLCYVLLDFAKADPDLDETPLAAALELSRQLELDVQFEKLAAPPGWNTATTARISAHWVCNSSWKRSGPRRCPCVTCWAPPRSRVWLRSLSRPRRVWVAQATRLCRRATRPTEWRSHPIGPASSYPKPLLFRSAGRRAGRASRPHHPNQAHRRSTIVDPSAPTEPGKVLETERQMFSLREGENQNPYSWDFDLCSLALGNFNYRKMTLVRDYAKLIETDLASGAFDTVFSLSPKRPEEAPPPPLELAEQHLIISCDATQASAVARARTGTSYIIQGPPGTGKSQTITNLIADYVARGRLVLFVCEKRAAIDVVFHRLRQQGLDELCCLIHDSQTDKKTFIQNLKQTYEKFLSQADLDPDAEQARAITLRAMEQDLAGLRRFSEVMRQTHAQTGIAVRSLLHRLVELRGRARELPPAVEEVLPEYPLWLQHGEVIDRLQTALSDLGEDLCFAKHPLCWLGNGVLQADRPIETLSSHLDQAEDLLDAIESALELSGLPGELWDTFEEIQALLEFAVRALPLAERDLLRLLADGPPPLLLSRNWPANWIPRLAHSRRHRRHPWRGKNHSRPTTPTMPLRKRKHLRNPFSVFFSLGSGV